MEYSGKYVWSNTQQAVVPKYVILGDNSGIDLSTVTQSSIDTFLNDFFDNHGFNGVHVPVYGQWFHIGTFDVTNSDSAIDQATFDTLLMIINTVYGRGGHVHLWQWGDSARGWSSAQLANGIMGAEEQSLLDEIYGQMNDVPGWSMGYGFDLWEWVTSSDLQAWHDYLNAKPDFRHLIGGRAQKNEINQIYQGTTNWYNGYEQHEPSYSTLVSTADHASPHPAHSEDRFRVRNSATGKDFTEDQTRIHLWNTTMAGGVAGIYGNLGSDGTADSSSYSNAVELLTHETFWHTTPRFRKDMVRDNALVTGGVALRDGNTHYVYFVESTGSQIDFSFSGSDKQAIAVDTAAAYSEIDLGILTSGSNSWTPPHTSDWAIAVGSF